MPTVPALGFVATFYEFLQLLHRNVLSSRRGSGQSELHPEGWTVVSYAEANRVL
jgi:hypothetical protein